MKALDRGQRDHIVISLNGKARTGACDNRTLLADFLRHELGATGTHVGCEHGVCGACTVQVEGVAVRSCMMLAVQAEGLRVDTVEGLARKHAPASATSPSNAANTANATNTTSAMGDLQAAFKRHHALQCGFCTAGILMACDDFLARVPDPTEQQVRETLSGHLCRCTGYTNIVLAVLETARDRLTKKHAGGEEANA
ncbi:(2Fe-2S)-binding protein [Bordetella flabilis]|uniref:(2Fe-2S)-binding protein n=1 Tax=Bordetella flabilis TaxID=463014 RepID=A0A193GEQ7_9BORD|nr:(2Fe-2S)-binding protein [Bordetella flabilis]ANN77936.1 (2Fe-2S)-binding protein [Bordetella flabilis]